MFLDSGLASHSASKTRVTRLWLAPRNDRGESSETRYAAAAMRSRSARNSATFGSGIGLANR
jgi:hypothetical protein